MDILKVKFENKFYRTVGDRVKS